MPGTIQDDTENAVGSKRESDTLKQFSFYVERDQLKSKQINMHMNE
jgi:hypothetical protein